MIAVTRQVLDDMAQAIVDAVEPEKVILFGSRVNGTPAPDSDVDLVVIEAESFGPGRGRRAELRRIRQALRPFKIPKDILVYSLEEMAYWEGSLNHVLAQALRQGETLYERS